MKININLLYLKITNIFFIQINSSKFELIFLLKLLKFEVNYQ